MSKLTKHTMILKDRSFDELDGYRRFTSHDGNNINQDMEVYYMPKIIYEDFKKPNIITITVAKGDRVN